MEVTFLPMGIKIEVKKGESLLEVAGKASVLIDGTCAGKGRCGKCRVRVMSGDSTTLTDAEYKVLSNKEINLGYRLACHVKIEDDMIINVPSFGHAKSTKKKLVKMPEGFKPVRTVRKHCILLDEAEIIDQKCDVERILRAFGADALGINTAGLPDIPVALSQGTSKVTITEDGRDILRIEAGDTEEICYGIAFDIGTTTVVGMLWDIESSELVDVVAMTNPQSNFGADVISRINFCHKDPQNLRILHEALKSCLNELILQLTMQCHIKGTDIYEATIVGNTTMSHLMLGVDPFQLAKAPFVPVFCKPVAISAASLGIGINPHGTVNLLPNIAGHVGSDIVGVLLASRISEKKGVHIAVDIGTNGEIILVQDGRILVCSTAAGPAFEGAAIYSGMRAAPGAIDSVVIGNGKVTISTIEGLPPAGICGSGLIDAVAQMLEAGLIDKTGKLLDCDHAELKSNIDPRLEFRLRKGSQGNEFVLHHGEQNHHGIVVTQRDIREMQLGKGAIRAGIMTLLKLVGADASQIESIMIAGAFGNYIRHESALRIGLIPDIALDRIIAIGNAAGAGASMALLSRKERVKAQKMAEAAEHIELSCNAAFQDEFIKSMHF